MTKKKTLRIKQAKIKTLLKDERQNLKKDFHELLKRAANTKVTQK
jgi:hypothetical protein